jgi:biopolymer transport protein ExbB/TolQ
VSKSARILLIVGLVLTFGCPLLGLAFTVISMAASFHDLGQNGIADPQALAGHVGNVMAGTIVGFASSITGVLVILAAGLVIYSERRKKPR